MGETMTREQAAAKLVSMMVGDMSLNRSMPMSKAKDAAIGAVTGKAVDLVLEVDALRAQLTEKDREIERLRCPETNEEWRILAEDHKRLLGEIERLQADSKTLNELGHALGRCYCTDSGCYTAEPEALMERVQELTAKERGEWDWNLMRRERDDALAQLSASQAREREAVEMAEETEVSKKEFMSALAAARKALGTAWEAMCERRGYADGWEWKYGTTWDEEDAEVSAALNGDSHE